MTANWWTRNNILFKFKNKAISEKRQARLKIPAASSVCTQGNSSQQATITYTNKFGIHSHEEPADFETRMAQRKCQMLQVIDKLKSKTKETLLQTQMVDFQTSLKPGSSNNISKFLKLIQGKPKGNDKVLHTWTGCELFVSVRFD